MKTFQAQVDADAKVLREQEKEINDRIEISNFCERHSEVIDCDANFSLIKRYLADADIDEANLEAAYEHTGLRQQLAKQTREENRAAVQEKIVALLGASSPGTIAHEKAKWPYKSTEELREKLKQLEVKRDMQSKTPEQLRAIVKTAPPSRWKPMPECYKSRAMLMDLINTDVPGFKNLVKNCGSEQINAVLNRREGRD
jgi:hypothetical protein